MKKITAIIISLLCLMLVLSGCAAKTGDVASEVAPAQYPAATTQDVQSALKDGSAVVIDTRSQSAYSGWATGENTLGGHIGGAVDYSANWLNCAYDEQNNYEKMTRLDLLRKYMQDKKITSETSVILYDENGKDAVAVADFLASEGLTSIRTYSLKDWSGPLVKDANYELWVPASVVHDVFEGKSVAEIAASEQPIILEVSWGKEDESGYLNGHVPGALHINSAKLPWKDFSGGGPAGAVHILDAVTAADGAPFAVGYMEWKDVSFPWKLDYHEVCIVLQGQLCINIGGQCLKGGPGDALYLSKGAEVEFAATDYVKFAYVIWPADWA